MIKARTLVRRYIVNIPSDESEHEVGEVKNLQLDDAGVIISCGKVEARRHNRKSD